ncbi:hypothetical protein AYO20_03809 [Fonsecaea nubica]|uniref:Uncharacterized protein n=1 Tax=Fonsecaea nubica TaxID=856822 RepID=A0A178D4A8_9EURO|nr:hypothetical protein AYO20_03809 [Fonsecaea nubica]OAL37040.1 hypothetical protein AYO20_03809 [Fonsecaea nubica]
MSDMDVRSGTCGGMESFWKTAASFCFRSPVKMRVVNQLHPHSKPMRVARVDIYLLAASDSHRRPVVLALTSLSSVEWSAARNMAHVIGHRSLVPHPDVVDFHVVLLEDRFAGGATTAWQADDSVFSFPTVDVERPWEDTFALPLTNKALTTRTSWSADHGLRDGVHFRNEILFESDGVLADGLTAIVPASRGLSARVSLWTERCPYSYAVRLGGLRARFVRRQI